MSTLAIVQPELWPEDVRALRAAPSFTWLRMIGRLRPAATAEQARAQLATVSAQLAAEHPETYRDVTFELAPGVVLTPQRRAEFGEFFGLLLAVTALVLLTACANAASTGARGRAPPRRVDSDVPGRTGDRAGLPSARRRGRAPRFRSQRL
jgi:hypothetical protein